MLATEKELIGFYISGHPLATHEWTLNTFALQRLNQLAEIAEPLSKNKNQEIYVRIGGLVDQYRKVFTKKDPPRPYARFCIEGLEGAINAVIWPDDFQALEQHLEDGKIIMAGAKLALDFRDSPELQISEIIPLDEANKIFSKKVSIHFSEAAVTDGHLTEVQTIIHRHPGSTPLHACVILDSGEKVFIRSHDDLSVTPTHELQHELEQLLGENSVYIETRQQPLLRKPARPKWQRGK